MKFIGWVASLSLLATSAWAAPVNVEIVDTPNQRWQFHRVTASENNNALVISGRMTAPLMPRPSGHVDVAAFSPDGKKLAETTTRHMPPPISPKRSRKGGVSFSATLPGPLPPGSVVKVAFHADPATNTALHHVANIAQ